MRDQDVDSRQRALFIAGYQQALVDLGQGLGIHGEVIWSKDPAIHAAAVERYETWRAGLDTRFTA